MKSIRKLIAAVMMSAAMILCLQMSVMAATDKVSYSFTDNSITLKWVSPELSTGAKLDSFSVYDSHTKTYIAKNISPASRSLKITSISKGYVGYWSVRYNYTTAYGSKMTDFTLGSLYVNTTPAVPANEQYGVSGVLSYTKKVCFTVARNTNMSGAQLELYKGSKKIGTYNFSQISDYIPVKNDAVYKYRVRAYYTNHDNQKTYYSGWTAFKYFDMCGGKIATSYSTNGCDITLKRVSGVKSYTIQVSKSKDSGYKKVGTVTVSGKKKTVHVEKCGKATMANKTTYYIRIIPNLKIGSKTIKSEVFGTYSLYNSHR